jgi:hypothetical protein
MLAEIERQNPSLDLVQELTSHDSRRLAYKLWEDRKVFTDSGTFTNEVSELLEDVGQSLPKLDQDKRDSVVTLLDALVAEKEALPSINPQQQVKIAQAYIKTIRQLEPTTDWLGAPWTLLEIGKTISAILGKELDFVYGMRLRGELAAAWGNYAANVVLSDKTSFGKESERRMFSSSFRPFLGEVQASFLQKPIDPEAGKYERAGPSLNKAQEELIIWYGQSAKPGNSAKLRVLRGSKRFIEELSEIKIDIANFWNEIDPTQSVEKVDQALTIPEVADLFYKKFKNKFGEEFDQTTPPERRSLGDSNLDILREVYSELYQRQTNFEETKQRIIGQIEVAQTIEKPAKKLKPIVKWIQQIDPEFTSTSAEDIISYIESHQQKLRDYYVTKNSPLSAALDHLGALLPPKSSTLRFMERNLFDVKSGNITADCTAWNMDLGFNAWTIPVWVTNPSFNFVYIYKENQMIAKLGLILTHDQNEQPAVVIDSIETNKNLDSSHELDGLTAIYQGFAELQAWADRNNFGNLRVCTFTNSQELTAELPITSEMDEYESQRKLTFVGLSATQEILSQVDKTLPTPNIYLQSDLSILEEGQEEEDEGPDRVDPEFAESAAVFEKIARNALEQ